MFELVGNLRFRAYTIASHDWLKSSICNIYRYKYQNTLTNRPASDAP